MSFFEEKPDTASMRLILIMGLIAAMVLYAVHEGKKYQRSGTSAELTKE